MNAFFEAGLFAFLDVSADGDNGSFDRFQLRVIRGARVCGVAQQLVYLVVSDVNRLENVLTLLRQTTSPTQNFASQQQIEVSELRRQMFPTILKWFDRLAHPSTVKFCVLLSMLFTVTLTATTPGPSGSGTAMLI